MGIIAGWSSESAACARAIFGDLKVCNLRIDIPMDGVMTATAEILVEDKHVAEVVRFFQSVNPVDPQDAQDSSR